jgi:hypothetical protein
MRRRGLERNLDAGLACVDLEILQQPANPFGTTVIEHPVERFQPLPGFDRIDIVGGDLFRSAFAHADL